MVFFTIILLNTLKIFLNGGKIKLWSYLEQIPQSCHIFIPSLFHSQFSKTFWSWLKGKVIVIVLFKWFLRNTVNVCSISIEPPYEFDEDKDGFVPNEINEQV